MLEHFDLDIHYEAREPEGGDYLLVYPERMVLVKSACGGLGIPMVGELPEGGLSVPKFGELPEDGTKRESRYLFSIGGKRFFTVFPAPEAPFGGYENVEIRALRNAEPRELAFALTLGHQLVSWYDKNLYCGRCGAETRHQESERSVYCPECGNLIYPQICPCIIVGIIRDGKLLVTRYNPAHQMIANDKIEKPTPRYALVAGYVEAGETPEDTVRREALEEVGLKVKNIRYFGVQPWPATASLLFGFFCEADGNAPITREADELSFADFLAPQELPDRSADHSLTGTMMEAFRRGEIA